MAAPKGKALLVKAILALLVIVPSIYFLLPEAYCDLEDSTVRYVYMSDSHKTVTKVIPSLDEEGKFEMMDDRCQKGMTIGQWVKVNKETIEFNQEIIENLNTEREQLLITIELLEANPVGVVSYVDFGTGEIRKFWCTAPGISQKCYERPDLEMPFE